MEGTRSKNKQLCSDFMLLENILAKQLVILPQEEDYGFNNKKKNKGMVVKLIQRGSLAEVRPPGCWQGLCAGSKAEAAGLSAGQCILGVNCSSMASEGALGVLKHFRAFQSCGQEWPVTGLTSAVPVPLAEPPSRWPSGHPTVENINLEPGVMCEYVSSIDIWYHMQERIMESCGCFGLTAKFVAQLKSWVSPAFKQAALELHVLCSLNFWPTNYHVNLMEVSNPKITPSVGRSFSIQFRRTPSLISLDPNKCSSKQDFVMSYTRVRSNSSYLGSDKMGSDEWPPRTGRAPVHWLSGYFEPTSMFALYGKNHLLLALLKCTEGEWAMLEDIWVTLSELDSVTFSFKQLDKNCVANTNVFYHIEGSQEALNVVFYFSGYHFSKLPSRQENRASLQPHTVLFTKAQLSSVPETTWFPELGLYSQPTPVVQMFYLELLNLPKDASTTAMKIDQLICPINALDELCHLVKSFVHSKPGTSRSLGASLIPVSSELCYHLGACQMAMSILSVSLEQVAILAQSHGLLPKCMMQATDMQKQDPRVEILAKNVSVKDHMPQGAPCHDPSCPAADPAVRFHPWVTVRMWRHLHPQDLCSNSLQTTQ
ncbi:Phosphatidylinositol 3,4,5-trisphosphate-dependent Rac exchanger 1 protein [Sciurus carolinensis]|uniref:Phosphatidylinositol 3,4,5-trisphosphate-dependent Rac exchanger 1 protein n=1 Tax=Sciurus carolinensis TaxID=30640 RepID=A0AA41TAY7_SCICA|nr:Phosphatidylinositol 3,4,5-trisphosphate-dependent Rac exchanger 1 protein [Sciurus carolinensis]